jgi:hypothetical protein
MNALEKLESQILSLWEQRATIKGEADHEAQRQAEAEAAKAATADQRRELYEEEAAVWSEYEEWLAAGAQLLARLDAVHGAMGPVWGKPRHRMNKVFRRAHRAEMDRKRLREKIAAGRDPRAERRERAAYLRQVHKKQKQAARRVRGDEGQADARVAATERKIRELEGKGPKPEFTEADMMAMDARNMARAHLNKSGT